MGKQYVYARVSSEGQNIDSQMDILKEAYPDGKVFVEKESAGSRENRKELEIILRIIDDGDELVVYKLDRLARCQDDLQDIMKILKAKNVKLRIHTMPMDFDTPFIGDLIIYVLGMVAEMERHNIKTNQSRGVQRAKKEGKYLGKQRDVKKWNEVRALIASGQTIVNTAKIAGLDRATVYRVIRYDKALLDRDAHKKTVMKKLNRVKRHEHITVTQLARETKIPTELVKELVDELREERANRD